MSMVVAVSTIPRPYSFRGLGTAETRMTCTEREMSLRQMFSVLNIMSLINQISIPSFHPPTISARSQRYSRRAVWYKYNKQEKNTNQAGEKPNCRP